MTMMKIVINNDNDTNKHIHSDDDNNSNNNNGNTKTIEPIFGRWEWHLGWLTPHPGPWGPGALAGAGCPSRSAQGSAGT